MFARYLRIEANNVNRPEILCRLPRLQILHDGIIYPLLERDHDVVLLYIFRRRVLPSLGGKLRPPNAWGEITIAMTNGRSEATMSRSPKCGEQQKA